MSPSQSHAHARTYACTHTHTRTHTCTHAHMHTRTHAHTHTRTHAHTHNSYIPQTEQHEPEGRMLFCLGNVTNLLDVTPSNPMPHPLSPPLILLYVI